MSNNLNDWARKWNVPATMLRDLQIALGTYTVPLPQGHPAKGKSEAWVQSSIRLEAAEKGIKLFRNNSGALPDKNGRPIRFGLGNDSKAINDVLKSHDLIGFRPLLIEPRHVGHILAQFVSRECKPSDWQYTSTDHERAQLAWGNLVNSCGGDACFATRIGSL